jgi:hypothetical protein
MSYKHYMIWSDWFAYKLHASLNWGSISFSIVTRYTGANQVFPGVCSPSSLWHYMVNSQGIICFSAILAPMIIASQDVFAGKDDFLVGDADVY